MKIIKIIKIIILVLWMIVIFLLSNQTGSESTVLSDGVISSTICKFVSNCDPDVYSFIVRKTAHFIMYLILGIFSVMNFKNAKEGCINALILCITYAFFDEIHQMFVGNRSGEVRDIIIDTFGALSGILIYYKIKKRS